MRASGLSFPNAVMKAMKKNAAQTRRNTATPASPPRQLDMTLSCSTSPDRPLRYCAPVLLKKVPGWHLPAASLSGYSRSGTGSTGEKMSLVFRKRRSVSRPRAAPPVFRPYRSSVAVPVPGAGSGLAGFSVFSRAGKEAVLSPVKMDIYLCRNVVKIED